MSDIGIFPPGSGLALCSTAWMAICALGLAIFLLFAFLRSRKKAHSLVRDPFSGWAVGALVSGVAAAISVAAVTSSGSLGEFAQWVERGHTTTIWLTVQATLWPAVALLWNGAMQRRSAG